MRNSLSDHPVLGPDYQRGMEVASRHAKECQQLGFDQLDAAVERLAVSAAETAVAKTSSDREDALWALMLLAQLRDAGQLVADLAAERSELEGLLPRLHQRVFDSGFEDGLRQATANSVLHQFDPVTPTFVEILEQCTRWELEVMLLVLPHSRNFNEFVNTARAQAEKLQELACIRAAGQSEKG
jgi:hypothetical protein